MRSQWCREHIDEVAKKCDLEKRAVRTVKQAAKFCQDHPELEPLATDAVLTIARVRDPAAQKAIIEKLTPSIKAGGRPTAQTIEEILHPIARLERGSREMLQEARAVVKKVEKKAEGAAKEAPGDSCDFCRSRGPDPEPLPEDQVELQLLTSHVGYVEQFTFSWLQAECLRAARPDIVALREAMGARYPDLWRSCMLARHSNRRS